MVRGSLYDPLYGVMGWEQKHLDVAEMYLYGHGIRGSMGTLVWTTTLYQVQNKTGTWDTVYGV